MKASRAKRYEKVSVIICTLNEENSIARAIDSVAWADEILVLDCGSTDRTADICAELGAQFEHSPWLGFSAQKNEAARRASHDWILSIDADEIVDFELGRSIADVLAGEPNPRDAFTVDRRGDFLGSLLPNSTRRSKRRSFVRLYNRRFSAWNEKEVVHETVLASGQKLPLAGSLLHINRLSVDEYINLYNRYATIEAKELWSQGTRAKRRDLILRPIARFGWHYVACGEWRLGMRGLSHAGIKAISDLVRYIKLFELEIEDHAKGF